MAIPVEPHTVEAFPDSAEPEFVPAPGVEVLAHTLISRHEELASLLAETRGEDATISIAYVFDTTAFDPAFIDAAAKWNVTRGSHASTDEDLRPKGEVNPAALRGEADRSSEPTPLRPRRANHGQPPAMLA